MAHEVVKKTYAISQFPTPVEAGPAAGGLVDFNATGDKFSFAPVSKIQVWRFGAIIKTAMDPDAGGFDLALDHRTVVGSDTGRTEKAVLNRADAETVAAGKVLYKDVILAVAEATAGDGSKVNVGPAGPLEVNPGEQIVLEVTNAVGAASDGYVWIEYSEGAFDKSDADVIVDA